MYTGFKFIEYFNMIECKFSEITSDMGRASPAGTPKTEVLLPPSLHIDKTVCREGHLVHIHFITTAVFFFFLLAILFLPLLLLVHSVQGSWPVLELHQGPEPEVIL